MFLLTCFASVSLIFFLFVLFASLQCRRKKTNNKYQNDRKRCKSQEECDFVFAVFFRFLHQLSIFFVCVCVCVFVFVCV